MARQMSARLLREAALVGLLLLAAFAVRSMSFVPAVIDTDEGFYLVQARAWLRGGWPFTGVWDMHPPGAPAVFALVIALFGESVAVVRALGAVSVALAAWALAALVRAGGGSFTLGAAAAFLYLGMTPVLTGLATNTEVLFAPLVTGAMALGVRSAVRALEGGPGPGWGEIVAAGLLIGPAMAIKQVVFPEGCLAFALLVGPALWTRRLPLGRAAAYAAAYAALCAAPTLLFALAYFLRGEFAAFWDALVEAPLRYTGGRISPADAAWQTGIAVLGLLFAFLLAGLTLTGAAPAERRLRAIAWLWFAVASFAIAAPGMFFQHYFIIWMPPLAVLAALGASRLVGFLGPARPRTALIGLVAIAAIASWRLEAMPRFERGFGLRDADPVRVVAATLRELVPAGSAVFVANYHPVIHVLADVEPLSRFVFPASLTGHFSSALPVDADEEVARILAARPDAILLDRGWMHTLRHSAVLAIEAALAADYEIAARVPEERGPVEIWRRAGLRPAE
jgi:4-amino-4-deoxy-L-arabinose transferase-like glycosyltransferase